MRDMDRRAGEAWRALELPTDPRMRILDRTGAHNPDLAGVPVGGGLDMDDVCTRAFVLEGLREVTGRGDLHSCAAVVGNGVRWAVTDCGGWPMRRGDGWRSTEAEAATAALEVAGGQ